MRRAGAALQAAIFTAVENNKVLAAQFSLAASGEVAPQFSYDGMASQWRDESSALAVHEIGFSIWGPQAGFADAEALGEKLAAHVEKVKLKPPYALVQMRLQSLSSGFDTATRLWRQRLIFEALTHTQLALVEQDAP